MSDLRVSLTERTKHRHTADFWFKLFIKHLRIKVMSIHRQNDKNINNIEFDINVCALHKILHSKQFILIIIALEAKISSMMCSHIWHRFSDVTLC